MTQRGELIELHFAEGASLRTNFVWRDDRYAHVVTLIEPSGEQTLLESAEGDPNDPWPPSPAFQHLSMQGEGDQRVALLVGMAGKSHWSMSVEASPAQRGIVFDVACRVNSTAESLGSSYRANKYEMLDPCTAAGPAGARRCTIMVDPTFSSDTQTLSLSADELRIDGLVVPSPPAYTARWKYAVRLA